MVAARSAAMGFNRLVDARYDALNPRTAQRELPRGAMSRREALDLPRRRRRGVSSPSCCAAQPAVPGAVAGRAGDRVLVLAGQALHAGRRSCSSGWRWRWRRSAAGLRPAAAWSWQPVLLGAGHRHVGGRVRRAVRLPGPGLRSRARAAVDSGAVRRAGVARDLAGAARRRPWPAWSALGVRRRPRAGLLRAAWRWSRRCSSTSSRW